MGRRGKPGLKVSARLPALGRRGFGLSLVEMVVAIAVLSIGMLVVLRAFAHCASLSQRTYELTGCMNLARQEIQQMMAVRQSGWRQTADWPMRAQSGSWVWIADSSPRPGSDIDELHFTVYEETKKGMALLLEGRTLVGP